MHRLHAACLGIGLGLAAVCCLVAWQESPQGPQLVTLNIVARDSHGKPASDLVQDDFQVFDNGKPQRIALFRRNEDKLAAAPHLGPHEFSNRAGVTPPNITVILLDVMNSPIQQQGYAKNQIVHALQRLDSAENLSFYLLSPEGLSPVHPLPSGEEDGASGAWTKQVEPLLDSALSKVFRMNPNFLPEERVNLTYLALHALASRLASVPGRKSIVWITRGLPLTVGARASSTGASQDFEPMLRRLGGTIERANVAIYPVGDLAGALQRDSAPPPATGRPGDSPDFLSRAGGVESGGTLEAFASLTGGRAHLDNNVAAAIQEAMEDGRVSYQIGYYPASGSWDGAFHKIKVTCARHGIHIQAKQGYYAYAARIAQEDQEEAAVEAAAKSQFDAIEIGLSAKLSPSETVAGAVHLQIRINAADLLLLWRGGGYHGQLTLTFVQYDGNGARVSAAKTPFRFNMTREQLDKAMTAGIQPQQDWTIDQKVRKARLLVYDEESNALGSVTFPIDETDRSAPSR